MIQSNGSNHYELGSLFGYVVRFHKPKRTEWVFGGPLFGSDVFHLVSLLLIDLFPGLFDSLCFMFLLKQYS
ncbi:PPM-type phosphatase domain-containing protein [Psidium guajava]|nr:PPM-type phosphatase domain-containing protein [Psidium guajava]